MRIWIAALALFFLIPVIAVSSASATHASASHSQSGKGTVALTHSEIVSGPKVLNQHTTLVMVKNTYDLTGTLTGTAVSIERDVLHNVTVAGHTIIFATFHGVANFTGTLNDKSGTLRIRYEGINNSTFVRGTFVVSGGTGQLVGVHGDGHFRGTVGAESPPLNYTIRWTVTTHTSHPEARDEDRDED